ncbi:hypothetical protein FHL15_002386 [Xylaria flabelliformis]|uniref:Uncharacterized protein n=1 Tax=Xylaria flabelliformis TaxID=2512241 RepID=A0A553I940_9PEZI|nr:hypothetical protein FHL15_002386 [Xylaria flabelliformis]
MAPFTLSIPGYRLGVHSHKQRHHDTTQQDAETRSPSPYAESDAGTQFSSTTSRLPSEAINPLSHSPDTLRQLAVAGLSPEDELPSRAHPGFPHKPLPGPRKRRDGRTRPSRRVVVSSESGMETDSTITSRQESRNGINDVNDKHRSARMRHLNTMTAIMHRCLRDGDIVRAKRALGLLMRTRDVDVRADNLWAIGLEILMRDGEQEEEEEVKVLAKRPSSPSSLSSGDAPSSSDTDFDSDIAGEDRGEDEGSAKGNPQPPQRWGSAANIAQVKQYLETLIQHHPYDAHRPQVTSAVDFWPALFGIEIHNLDAEFQNSLHRIHLEHGLPSSSSFSRSASPSPTRDYGDYEADRMDLDDDDDERKLRRRSDREEEEEEEEQDRERHNATDALRSETQLGALGLATRMDGILENPPYSTHAELLRLRGHVALFIADLYLSSRLMEQYVRHEKGQRRLSLRDVERRLREHARHSDEHVALARRREEQERAVVFFRRAVAAKGRLEDWVLRFLDEEDEEEEHD